MAAATDGANREASHKDGRNEEKVEKRETNTLDIAKNSLENLSALPQEHRIYTCNTTK
jgi:hypothetical protein